MKPIEVFRNGRDRAEYLLRIHELLSDRRKRAIRADWARNFKTLMHWHRAERIERVDGMHSVVILREPSALKRPDFQEEVLSEILRAALVGIVSALDRYCHDLIVSRVVPQLRRSSKRVNRELRELKIPILSVKAAVSHAVRRRGKGGKVRPRPMTIVRYAVQDVLHSQTFQRPNDISRGLRMVGIENLWGDSAAHMGCTVNELTKRLNGIIDRRNRIVHEGDVERRRKGGRPRLHLHSRSEVRANVKWVADLVDAIESIV